MNMDKSVNIPEDETKRQFYFMEKCKEWLDCERQKLGRPLRMSVQTLGCQMNARDSEKITAVLEQIGYENTEEKAADLVLYNTCTVRENANLKVYGRLGYLKKQKEKNPHMKIILCGCMMQEETVIEKIKKSYRFVDLIFGTHNIYKLAELLYTQICSETLTIDVWKEADQIVENLPSERKYFFKAGVNIMYGCNNFCSYCIVPYVRGRERSRKLQDILAEIRKLASEGVVEIMLLGQNVNSYGKGEEGYPSFASLLKETEKIEGIRRIRFMTSHPKDLSEELIEVLKNSKKICSHLHLPMQSGSTKVLAAMNRKYTREQYLTLVRKIKEAVPEISLTTDIIVGFPGETEADFEETLSLAEEVCFDGAYTFIYSRRTGTPAADMKEQVPEEVKKERFHKLLKVTQHVTRMAMEKKIGQTVTALAEEINEKDDRWVSCRLSGNAIVHCEGDATVTGQFIEVKLTENKGFYYMGEIVPHNA